MISHMPPIRNAALTIVKAQPPKNFERNSRDRETGLESSRSMAPGSNIRGTIGAVTTMAISVPITETKKKMKTCRAVLITWVSCFWSSVKSSKISKPM